VDTEEVTMQRDDMVLISVDDHIVEPPTMFDAHWPQKYRDRRPVIVKTADGGDIWEFEGERAVSVGLNAVAGCPPDEYNLDPTEYAQMRPGCWSIDERIGDMNAAGVLAGLNFPSFPHFCGQYFTRIADKDIALAAVRAYNDWHIDEWHGSNPDRFIPLSIPPLWSVDAMAEEIRRVAAKGCHAVTFSENPSKLGLPSYHTDYWDPFLAACVEGAVTVCLHIGSSSSMTFTAPDAPPEVMIALTPINSLQAITDILYSGVFKRFPGLQVAMSEGGIGWIPYALERADYVYRHHHAWTKTDLGGKLPSELFYEHFWTCFIDDRAGIEMRHLVGADRIMWEMDYPHSDSTWPNAPEQLWENFGDLPEEEIHGITHEHAMRAFSFDPFKHRAKEKATVAALRAEARGVDTSIKSMGRRKADAGGGALSATLAGIASTGASKAS
jgi:predicted TIM-barrel fold metal-dependent hydrolase